MLEMFAVEIAGATEVKYVPGYFPFTEPSIEVHIKHPVLGWFELGGSGIFRPEVTKAMGIDCPVLAWGIGIDRMALMALGCYWALGRSPLGNKPNGSAEILRMGWLI